MTAIAKFIGILILMFMVPMPAHAECSAEMRIEQRRLQDTRAAVLRNLVRAEARLQGQERRIAGLGDVDLPVSVAPTSPNKTTSGFDADGKVPIDCAAPETVPDTLASAADGLTVFEFQVSDFIRAVDAREDMIIAIEDQATVEPNPQQTAQGADDIQEGESDPDIAAQNQTQEQVHKQPLRVEDNDLIYQRLLTLPDAEIVIEPGSDNVVRTVPPFTVLYVFDRRQLGPISWLQVGQSSVDAPIGWLTDDRTLAWNSALVMQFKPVGKRKRVLFFAESRDLVDVITDFQFVNEARGFYGQLDDGTLDDDRFVAAEPQTAVEYGDEPYLLPIVDHIEEVFDDGTLVNIVKVASVSLKSRVLPEKDDSSFQKNDEDVDFSDFRVGVTFVMDTTASMGPYIRMTHKTVRAIYEAFDSISAEARTSFGLVAYRDNLDHDNRIGFVTEIFQALDPEASVRSVVANIGAVNAARVPTVDWREDAYAGVAEAIEAFDWSPFSARMIILITDASAREGNDALASRSDITTSALAEAARAKNIAIVPIHLITREAERLGDVQRAASQYADLGRTGDENSPKYLDVSTESESEFRQEIEGAARVIVNSVLELAEKVAEDSVPPEPNDGFLTSDAQQGGGERGPEGRLASLVANELLRAQLEYLGRRDEASAPSFVAGWAADRDLTNPEFKTLEFSVFLNRNQISALAQSVSLLVDTFRSAGTSPGAFFDDLQLIAARTSRNPDRVRADENVAVREILPAFLQGLPYRSEVLKLDREFWNSLSTADRENFVEALEEKLAIYQQRYEQTENWVDFGAGDPALEAYPLPLTQLP